jgi:hypothetical protein
MYSSGATTFPVWPIWYSFGTKPASTAAREAPTAPFNLSASFSNNTKLSPLFRPRPPATTTRAVVRSGLSDLLMLEETNVESGDLEALTATVSIAASLSETPAFSNAVVLIVRNY